MFDKLDRPRSTAHKKAAAVAGEAEDCCDIGQTCIGKDVKMTYFLE